MKTADARFLVGVVLTILWIIFSNQFFSYLEWRDIIVPNSILSLILVQFFLLMMGVAVDQ